MTCIGWESGCSNVVVSLISLIHPFFSGQKRGKMREGERSKYLHSAYYVPGTVCAKCFREILLFDSQSVGIHLLSTHFVPGTVLSTLKKINIVIWVSWQHCGVSASINSFIQMREQKQTEVKWLAQGHIASSYLSLDLNSRASTLSTRRVHDICLIALEDYFESKSYSKLWSCCTLLRSGQWLPCFASVRQISLAHHYSITCLGSFIFSNLFHSQYSLVKLDHLLFLQ